MAAYDGSAPHMRGIPWSQDRAGAVSGISPAHAGNTGPAPAVVILRADQPRTCGEYARRRRRGPGRGGSAPHMRGIPAAS